MIRTVSGIDLATRPMERADRPFIGSRWTHRQPRLVTDAILDGCTVLVWCSAAHVTALHGYVAVAGRMLIDAFTVPAARQRGLMREALRELLGGELPERVECATRWPWPSSRYRISGQRAA